MSTFAIAVTEVFNDIHREFGKPKLRIYPPVAEWTLDAGMTYNSLSDTFVDSDGDATTQAYSDQSYTEANYVAVGGGGTVEVAVPGVTEVPTLTVYVKCTSAVDGALDDAWGVEVPGGSANLYRISDRSYLPHGVSSPSVIVLQLSERNA